MTNDNEADKDGASAGVVLERIVMWKTTRVFIGLLIISLCFWAGAYTFELWPWGDDFKWWYIPHAISVFLCLLPFFKIGWDYIPNDF